MRERAWIASGFLMTLMAVAVVLLLTIGARWLLNARQASGPLAPAQSGPVPKVLADEIKRKEQASYLRGINDAVEFWHLTGVVPDAPVLRDALWARDQASPDPLTASEAEAILQLVNAQATP
jgi:hypothetical protein